MTPGFGFTPDDEASLLAKVDAAYIIGQIKGASGPQLEQLANDIASALSQAQRAYSRTDVDQSKVLRVLHNMTTTTSPGNGAIRSTAAGTVVDLDNKSLFKGINTIGGSATVNAQNHEIVDLQMGSGSDCMFDVLVSSCFASLAGFTEGQSFTSLSGCTFVGYSTVTLACTYVSGLAGGTHQTIYICSKATAYAENPALIGPANATVTIVGASREGVTITGQVAAGATLAFSPASLTLRIFNLSVIAHGSSGARALSASVTSPQGGSLFNVTVNSGGNSGGIGLDPGNASVGWYAEDCTFSGSGTGIVDGLGGDTSDLVGNVKLVNCQVSSATGARLTNDGNLRAVQTQFTGAVGVEITSSNNATRLELEGGTSFACSTAGIRCTGAGSFKESTIMGVDFTNCTVGIKMGTAVNGANNNRIIGNEFLTGTASFKAIDDTSGALRYSVVVGNTFEGYTSGNEIVSGIDLTDNTIGHNLTDSGATLPDTHTTAGSGAAASSAEPFVTIGNSANLSAERALTAGNGVGFTDGGADSTVTLKLVDLTAAWTQAGVFDISHAGNLTVLKHAAIGSGAALSTAQILAVQENIAASTGSLIGVNGQILATGITANANTVTGLNYNALVQDTGAGPNTQTGIVAGVKATTGGVGITSLTVSDMRSFDAVHNGAANMTVTARAAYYARNAGASGTLTTQYAHYIENMTRGATNWAIYSLGGNSSHLGSFQFGGNSTPASIVDIRGAATFDGIAAPSTPASDDYTVYNQTTTELLKAKDDQGFVYDLTHNHVVHWLIDGTTTAQKAKGPPMPHAGTITGIFSSTCDGVTIGATAWVGTIYKVAAASVNTDGGTSEIFSTRPTITNGNMRQNYGAPDSVTTFAAGDILVAATTQVGTSASFVAMSATVRYT